MSNQQFNMATTKGATSRAEDHDEATHFSSSLRISSSILPRISASSAASGSSTPAATSDSNSGAMSVGSTESQITSGSRASEEEGGRGETGGRRHRTVGFHGVEDLGAEGDLGEVVDSGVGEKEELVGQHQVPLLLPLLAGAAVHLARRRGVSLPSGSAGSRFGRTENQVLARVWGDCWFGLLDLGISYGWKRGPVVSGIRRR